MKFNRSLIERLRNKFKKLEQAKPRKSNYVNKHQPSNRKQPPMASEEILRPESKNKESEVYPVVLPDQLVLP